MKINDPASFISDLRRHANELRVMADQLERDQHSTKGVAQSHATALKPLEFSKLVDSIIELRKIRERFIPARLLAAGGWDILLYLFKETAERGGASITKASFVGSVSQTTALRTIDRLAKAGLVEKEKAARGSKRTDVRLSQMALEALMKFFATTHVAIEYEAAEHSGIPQLREIEGALDVNLLQSISTHNGSSFNTLHG